MIFFPLKVKISKSFWAEAKAFLPYSHWNCLNEIIRVDKDAKWTVAAVNNLIELESLIISSAWLAKWLGEREDCVVMASYSKYLYKNLLLIKKNLKS